MNKKERKVTKNKKNDNGFNLTLIICTYLIMDVILLFVLCLLEINGLKHETVLIISLILEFIATLFVTLKGNIKSAIILYILFLVSPAFLNVIAMSMLYISDKLPFTPIVLLLFRTGYDLDANLLSELIRFILFFRIPALGGIIIGSLITLIKRKKIKNA